MHSSCFCAKPTHKWFIFKHFQLTELQLKRSREKLRNLCSFQGVGWQMEIRLKGSNVVKGARGGGGLFVGCAFFESCAANIIANTLCTLMMITADSFSSQAESMKRLFASFAGCFMCGNYCCAALLCRTTTWTQLFLYFIYFVAVPFLYRPVAVYRLVKWDQIYSLIGKYEQLGKIHV